MEHVIDAAVTHTSSCIKAKGGHFEHLHIESVMCFGERNSIDC